MSVRVLFTSTSGTGHVHPLVPIARECQRRGHEVRWAVSSDAVDRVMSYGVDAVPAGLTLGERAERFRASVDLRGVDMATARPIFFKGLFADLAAPAMREQLGPIVDDFRPDVMVHELCELAAAPIAEARGIPHVTVAFSGEPYPALVDPARLSVARVWEAEGLEAADDFGWFSHLYLHPWPESLGQRPLHPRVASTWHMGFDGAIGGAPEWTRSLGLDRQVVYVTFGTEMGPVAPWAALLEALGRLDADVVITTGGRIDPSEHAPIPMNVRVEHYVPQRFVLDRASLVVSHCGSGTLAAALERGLPHVAIPLGADQFDNARAVTTAGIAVMVPPTDRSADTIESAMRVALGGAEIQERCGEVRGDVLAMPDAAETAERVVTLAH